ncbi:hypothetical protein CVV68_22570 [Arthrobacter livingstonensis]|uniref:Transposase IS204/IS1001/IS1096/IS1165 DDE domain-containing protein n=1 Tax=Arthrobacter livingstonensis TaxID=670078 RepID=A0A2V5L228_9MICC|nr:hypothetical protein CVV68_22570 [Arthrobacter livingstonensis]
MIATHTHVEVEASRVIYQHINTACREPCSVQRRKQMRVVDSLSTAVAAALTESKTMARTLKRRAEDVLAYFERSETSNGPTKAINVRLEHLWGSALGFRSLANCVAKSLQKSCRIQPDPCHTLYSEAPENATPDERRRVRYLNLYLSAFPGTDPRLSETAVVPSTDRRQCSPTSCERRRTESRRQGIDPRPYPGLARVPVSARGDHFTAHSPMACPLGTGSWRARQPHIREG